MFDQVMRALDCGFRFRRGIAAKMKERGNQLLDLKLDLFAAEVRVAGQSRNVAKRAPELLRCFDQCWTAQPMSRPAFPHSIAAFLKSPASAQ